MRLLESGTVTCGEPGRWSNERSKRKQVNMADYEDNEEGFGIEELNDSDFVEELGELQHVLFRNWCATRRPPALRSDNKSFIQGV